MMILRILSATVMLTTVCLEAAFAQAVDVAPDRVQPAIDIAKSPENEAQDRIDAVTMLVENWKKTLPILIENIDAYYRTDEGQPYTQEDVAGLLPLTDLAVKIILTKDGGIQKFRESDTPTTIKLLTWAARDGESAEPNRNLRFNASYILAGVVDDGSLCIVLDHLRDKDLDRKGLNNLLQVAAGAAQYAHRENAEAAQATARILAYRSENAGAAKHAILARSLFGRAISSPNADIPLASDVYCRDYEYETTPAE